MHKHVFAGRNTQHAFQQKVLEIFSVFVASVTYVCFHQITDSLQVMQLDRKSLMLNVITKSIKWSLFLIQGNFSLTSLYLSRTYQGESSTRPPSCETPRQLTKDIFFRPSFPPPWAPGASQCGGIASLLSGPVPAWLLILIFFELQSKCSLWDTSELFSCWDSTDFASFTTHPDQNRCCWRNAKKFRHQTSKSYIKHNGQSTKFDCQQTCSGLASSRLPLR